VERTDEEVGSAAASIELDARRQLQKQYDRVVEEYDEMAALVAELRSALDRKNDEVCHSKRAFYCLSSQN